MAKTSAKIPTTRVSMIPSHTAWLKIPIREYISKIEHDTFKCKRIFETINEI